MWVSRTSWLDPGPSRAAHPGHQPGEHLRPGRRCGADRLHRAARPEHRGRPASGFRYRPGALHACWYRIRHRHQRRPQAGPQHRDAHPEPARSRDGRGQLPGGLYLQSAGPCGVLQIFRQARGGAITLVTVPHTTGDNRVLTALGSRLLIQAPASCTGSVSLLWFDPATRAEQWLIRAPAKAAGARSRDRHPILQPGRTVTCDTRPAATPLRCHCACPVHRARASLGLE